MHLSVLGKLFGTSALIVTASGIGLFKSNDLNKRERDSQTIGTLSAKHTNKLQWMFLFKLAGKVFDSMKEGGVENMKEHDEVIGWLIKRVNLKIEDTRITPKNWEGFREVCTQILAKENSKNLGIVLIPESRLCFMGKQNIKFTTDKETKDKLKAAIYKGHLGGWNHDEYSPVDGTKYSKLKFWDKFNWDLWSDFNKNSTFDLSEKNFDDKWYEWYKDKNTIISIKHDFKKRRRIVKNLYEILRSKKDKDLEKSLFEKYQLQYMHKGEKKRL